MDKILTDKFLASLPIRREDGDIEFKSAQGGFPGSFWESYSAFANTDGGYIILGVKEVKEEVVFDGLSDEAIDKLKKNFWSGVNNRNTISRNLLTEKDVDDKHRVSNRRILIFHIPGATFSQRPVYVGLDPYRGTYKRNFEGDFRCTEEEVRRMFSDGNIMHRSADSLIVPGFSIDRLDKDSIDQYRRLFDLAKPGHPWLSLDNKDLLAKIGAYAEGENEEERGVTIAGLLMFGKGEDIDRSPYIANFFPDYREVPENTERIRWIDRVCPDGTWEGNLFQFYRKVLPKIQGALPMPFRLEGNTRIDETPGHIAVREALVNFCIHSDYSAGSTMVILLSKEKIVFSNPGTLLISKDQFFKGSESICRNRNLQKMFMMLGASEKAGSGVDKIVSGWKDLNFMKPILDTKTRPDKVELTLPLESTLPAVVRNKLVGKFGEGVLNIGNDKLTVLTIVCSEQAVTHDRLRYDLDMHSSDISAMLAEMCRKGFLVGEGYGRGKRYYLQGENGASLKGERLQPKSGKVATSRVRIEDLRKQIIEVCEEYEDLDHIAEKVGKSAVYLRNKILKSMVDDGLLERLYPASNHPGQKYRKV